MNESDVKEWFAEYLGVFAACGRGERDASALLDYYGAPIFFATDAGCAVLTTAEDVLGVAKQQVEGMRAAQYHHSEVLSSETTVVNATSAIHRGAFARVRADGREINRLVATYVITQSPAGRRISALLVHR